MIFVRGGIILLLLCTVNSVGIIYDVPHTEITHARENKINHKEFLYEVNIKPLPKPEPVIVSVEEPEARVETFEPTPVSKNLEVYVRAYFKDIPIMAEIARCESTFRHIEGKITPSDYGVMQINRGYHLETATKLGYDIYTVDGNLGYARHLYNVSGLQPWSASKHCWGN